MLPRFYAQWTHAQLYFALAATFKAKTASDKRGRERLNSNGRHTRPAEPRTRAAPGTHKGRGELTSTLSSPLHPRHSYVCNPLPKTHTHTNVILF